MGLFKLLMPREFLEDLSDLDIDKFLKAGKDFFIFDFDNTLGLWRSCVIEERFQTLLNRITQASGKVLIASNGRPRQISQEGVQVIWRARKPLAGKIKRALLEQNVDLSRVVMIGDQIFTDVLAGNMLGVYTVKVRPLSTREFFGTKVLRVLERIVIQTVKKGDNGEV